MIAVLEVSTAILVGAMSATFAGALVELARAFLNPIRRRRILDRSIGQNFRHMLS